ncbi:MAG: DUF721 domain-containing protein [Hyphomonas sp.]|nr:DUF721 domain-containing protein [Hyphomonas sp.]
MVMRSSLDPIEEARARVRLRYQRARAVKPPMQQVGLAAERLTRKSGGAKMPAIQVLQARWREIAGEQLWKFCRPEKFTGGKDGRVLTLRVLPQAAPMVQHQSEIIRQRVSVAAGGDVTAIRLVQGPLRAGEAPKSRRVARALTPAEKADLDASAAGIEDDRLRAAIVALGAAMLTAGDDT